MNWSVIIWGFFLCFLLISAANKRDVYKVLDLPKSATKKQIKKAYKTLAKKHHPDKNPGDKNAAEKFRELAEAYEILVDEEKRRLYDRCGFQCLEDGGSGRGGFDPFDIFSRFGGGHHRHAEKTGPDVHSDILLTLEELFAGVQFDVEINKQILCPVCRGSGAENEDDVNTCHSCAGQGVKLVRQMLAPGIYQQMQSTCEVCKGKGKIVSSTCPHCAGKKVMRGSHEITVDIERGMADGQKLVFDREGDESPDYNSGNVIFTIKTSAHPTFTRRGDNLYMSESITLKESLVGFERRILHLNGEYITISRDRVTPSGFVQVVTEEGMPRYEAASRRGDLFVEYSIVFPDTLSNGQVDAIKSNF